MIARIGHGLRVALKRAEGHESAYRDGWNCAEMCEDWMAALEAYRQDREAARAFMRGYLDCDAHLAASEAKGG